MRSGLPITFMLSAAQVLPALAQAPASPSDRASLAAGTAAAGPVITCTSLANLRTVLRGANDDPVAAIPVITDPKSDLGCSVLDRKTVTGVADYVALNGRAYECLTLQNTNVCHWTVASSATPTISAPAPPRSAPSAPESRRRPTDGLPQRRDPAIGNRRVRRHEREPPTGFSGRFSRDAIAVS